MDLIDRYLAAVRRHLPRNLQDDVIQELTDNLRSEAEEREQEAAEEEQAGVARGDLPEVWLAQREQHGHDRERGRQEEEQQAQGE